MKTDLSDSVIHTARIIRAWEEVVPPMNSLLDWVLKQEYPKAIPELFFLEVKERANQIEVLRQKIRKEFGVSEEDYLPPETE